MFTFTNQIQCSVNKILKALSDILNALGGSADPDGEAILLPARCVNIDGGEPTEAIPVMLWDSRTSTKTGSMWITPEGDIIAGVVTVLSDCDCPCVECPTCELSWSMEGYDSDPGLVQAGETTAFRIIHNGNVLFNLIHDYTTTSDGVNKSSFYNPITSALNSIAGLTVTVLTDVPVADSGKVVWKCTYDGDLPFEMSIIKAPTIGELSNVGADQMKLSINPDCVLDFKSSWDGQGSDPFTAL